MKKLFTFVFAFMIFFTPYHLDAVAKPYPITRNIRYGYTITNKSDQIIHNVQFWTYGPVERTSSQQCESLKASHPFQLIRDRLGNQILFFQLNDLPPFGSVILNVEANLGFAEKPVATTESHASAYLSPGKYIQSDDVLIRKTAHSLKTENHLQTAKNVFDFVSKYIEYVGYLKQSHGALYALIERKGDCTEFMDLFLALCRADGIPARGLAGYRLHGSGVLKTDEYHNWAEFFFDGIWHTADPQRKDFMPAGGKHLALRIIADSEEDFMSPDEFFRVNNENLSVKTDN